MNEFAWIQTFTGLQFYPLNPVVEDIRIEDIAHALSNQCRFSGHTKEFYSVAEHSCRVAAQVPRCDALWGLLHDASEAYLVDLPKPIKKFTEIGKLYQEAESRLMACICERFGLPTVQPSSVTEADHALLMTEKRDLMSGCKHRWEDQGDPLKEIIQPMSPRIAELEFLHLFRVYTYGK